MRTILPTAFCAALVAAAPALADTAATRAVWTRHVEAATSGNLDAVLRDFGEDSAIVTPDGVLQGTAAIRGFFQELLGGLSPEAVESAVVNAEIAHDDVVVFNFTIGGVTFHDTALIRDDRIVLLSTHSYPAE